MAAVFKDIAAIAGDDGIVFDPASVRVEVIRKDAGYGGVRVTLNGRLANVRCVAQVNVGFGDAVTPGPSDAVYPVLLVSHGIEWRKPAEVDVQPAASSMSTDQKVTLFRRLFLGRTDVYPVRWESKAGKTG